MAGDMTEEDRMCYCRNWIGIVNLPLNSRSNLSIYGAEAQLRLGRQVYVIMSILYWVKFDLFQSSAHWMNTTSPTTTMVMDVLFKYPPRNNQIHIQHP